jgi:hypothetical protein
MKKQILKWSSLFILALFVVSCDDDDDDDTPPKAKVMIVHASPDAPAVDVRINDAVLLTAVAYPTNSPYNEINSGNTNVKFSPTGTTNYVINANATFDENVNYTIFAIDSAIKIKGVAVADNLTTPASGKSHVRFFHFSPNGPAVDIAVAGGTVLFPNRSFNDQSTNAALTAFTEVNAGTYNLEVRAPGTSTVIFTVPNVILEAGKIYTVFARGFVGGTGAQALMGQVIVNN